MAKYQFDELAKTAGSGEGIYDQLKKKEISEKEAIEDILHGSFRFSITDGYLVEKGVQFDYAFDFGNGACVRYDWRSGVPVKKEAVLSRDVMETFAKEIAFLYQLPQKQFVTDTKSTTVQTNAYEREKYGPIKRLTRAELRLGDKFFRWVPEEDEDQPFKELYEALCTLRKTVDESIGVTSDWYCVFI